jgi:hypothetical protein
MTAIAKARSSRSLFPIPRLIGPGLGSIRSTAGQTYLARTCGAGDPPRREQRLSLIETDSALAGVYAIAGVTRDRSGRSDYRSEPGSSPRIQFTKPLTSPSWPSVRSAGGQRSNPSSIPDNRRKQAGVVLAGSRRVLGVGRDLGSRGPEREAHSVSPRGRREWALSFATLSGA